MDKNIQIMVLGNGNTGKTCLLLAYKKKEFDGTQVPTVIENYPMEIMIDGKPQQMTIIDTGGQEDYDRLRQSIYKDCNVFIVCYSVASRTSFDNVKDKWIKELNYYWPNCIVILVATKSDLRQSMEGCIEKSEGLKMKKRIGAHDFVECSSKLMYNVNEVFEKAITAALRPKIVKKKFCVLL
ncbi:PREDICTED: ras-like GTP-binding protein RhoL [Nicrophorus vespilloides]|uniref:Ras-like GTP-binding protein RhoL n=1 Tax=Nicrophorus vespilloides TaxID=110193 RepID=A0ABM1M8S7_NICVS|nr:PREDICTED: ras-like GTP-binding protein RhoL [Nicrophorus vespilloides]